MIKSTRCNASQNQATRSIWRKKKTQTAS